MITQNIDMLHRRAGTRELVEVHGSIATCSCPACGGAVALERGARAARRGAGRRAPLRALRRRR